MSAWDDKALAIAFNAWWEGESNLLGDSHRYTAWNAWLASRAEWEREAAALREQFNDACLTNTELLARAEAAEQRAAQIERETIERCAKICDEAAYYWDKFAREGNALPKENRPPWFRECARKIRALAGATESAAQAKPNSSGVVHQPKGERYQSGAADLTGKWCTWCKTDTHNDSECWCTRPVDCKGGSNGR
jgi:hypothetical protein